MSERNQSNEIYVRGAKKIALIIMIAVLLAAIGTIMGSADVFYDIRIEYVFKDGTPAHDAYVATYREGEAVDLTVTNPKISGFTPMTAVEGGVSAETKSFHFDHISGNVTETVYYVPGLTNYKVVYFKQNIYDDLYTRENNVAEQYTNRFGYTGTNPTELTTENLFEGFTNLFHEPDAIAADGSTEFRVYYDRNYYTILFDLGEGGYGVDPIYAKYESEYHIGDPTRMGYTFKGWARTSADSTKGELGTDWNYIDEEGNTISEETAFANAFKFYEGEIPAKDQFFKAVWEASTTQYSVVYWIEKPDGQKLTRENIEATGSLAAARALISANYSVVVARDITGVESGTPVNLHTIIQNARGQDMELYNLFAYDLTNTANFPMSDATREELVGKEKYYEFNEDLSMLQFNGAFEEDQSKEYIEVAGDGTTRINVYYNRRDFTLKFYYAREGLTNGQPNGKISLTNSTKNFSKKSYYNTQNHTPGNPLKAVETGKWVDDIGETRPKIAEKYRGVLTASAQDEDGLYEDYNGYRYYYYQVSARYDAPLYGKWLIDAVTPVHKKGFADTEICYPGSWATENDMVYQYNNRRDLNQGGADNFTIKGIYDRLGDELMFRNKAELDYRIKTDGNTTLHFLLSWTNSSDTNNGWNYGVQKVLHFTYETYVELLPKEIELAEDSPNGYQVLIDNGTYIDVMERTFTDTIESSPTYGQSITRVYGLTTGNRVETIDSGDQYPFKSNPADRAANNSSIYSNQTAAEIKGLQLENYQKDATGKAVINASNTDIDWSQDSANDRRATIKFFYHRNRYKLKYRNGNRLDRECDVMYGAPLNSAYLESEDGHEAGEYRYYYENPEYFDENQRNFYSFEGWYYTPYYYKELDISTATMPSDDTTFYAKWDPKVIKVSFFANYNDFYQGINRIGDEIPVNYGDYIPIDDIPADTDDPDSLRPDLDPPTEGAKFSGWYYLRNNVPVRFEPENLPVTALNKQAASDENARLDLFAEWASNDIAKYYITYVEKDHPENEVAQPYLGRSFLYKTKTVNAKTGSELNEAHAWTENGINWWPTANSHSLVVEPNAIGGASPYSPNVYSFEYIQKRGVYYKVEYRDKNSNAELADPKSEVYSTHGSVREDAKFIPGYVVDEMSLTKTLVASTAQTEAEQKAEELENNVIVFYYDKNDSDYVYEVEYYKQNVENDDYFLFLTENREIPIAAEGVTSVSMQELYDSLYARLIEEDGFTRAPGASQVIKTDHEGAVTTTGVADDGSVVITGDTKITVRIYFDRNTYTYKYLYVDYHAERVYLDTPENEREGMWDGVIGTYDGDQAERVDTVVTIPAPQDITHNNIPYTRIENKDITLTIAPATELNPNVNTAKVYYRKYTDRELTYKLSCENEGQSGVRVDYEPITKKPLFGGLSMTLQTVDNYDGIADVTFYNYNNATIDNSGSIDKYLHYHKYTFLGWFDNPQGTGTPLTMNETLTKADLGLNGSLPARDTTYYAVVHEEMITTDFELRCVEQDLPIGEGDQQETEQDIAAAAIVEAGTTDTNGELTGCYIHLTDPLDYAVGAPIPWNKVEGYSLSIEPKDNKVYKYEFTEWWEEDLETEKLIRKKDLNVFGAHFESQLDRKQNRHIIAVFKRREVTELPYTINYHFVDRFGETKTFVKTGMLSGEQLNESSAQCCVTGDGDYRLTDECIIANSPYESNYGQTLRWSDQKIEKTSLKGDETEGTVDRVVTDVTAVQSIKTVHANYRTTPDGSFSVIQTFYGANYKLDEKMLAIRAPESYNGAAFSYWAVRKSSSDSAPIAARSYKPLFDLCMMDNYFITPVYEAAAQSPGQPSNEQAAPTPEVILTHLDYTRNRWTDEEGNISATGETDLLFTDFEIAFEDNGNQIFGEDSGYRTGVVFELCGSLGASAVFDPHRNYGFYSDPDALKTAVKNKASSYTTQNKEGIAGTKNRKIQCSEINTVNMTNRNRIEFSQYYRNNYTLTDNTDGTQTKKYGNSNYLMKATAYLIKGDEVTLSNSIYICLKSEAAKDLAIGDNNIWEITPSTP